MFAGSRSTALTLGVALLLLTGCGHEMVAADAPSPSDHVTSTPSDEATKSVPSAAAISTDFHPIPLNPAGTFPSGYPAVERGFEAQADAPFPASVFLATNRLTLVDGEASYLITGGRRGADGLSEKLGAVYIVVLDARSGEKRSEGILDVPECLGAVSISSDIDARAIAVRIDCLDVDTQQLIWSGVLNAVDGSFEFSS